MGLRTMLTALGHEVLLAANGRDALQIVRNARPDLALLDLQMPLTDGLEAAKAIARKRPMPIIILTAFSQEDLLEEAAQLPIQGYLVKPVNERDLAAAIEVAMARFDESSGRRPGDRRAARQPGDAQDHRPRQGRADGERADGRSGLSGHPAPSARKPDQPAASRRSRPGHRHHNTLEIWALDFAAPFVIYCACP